MFTGKGQESCGSVWESVWEGCVKTQLGNLEESVYVCVWACVESVYAVYTQLFMLSWLFHHPDEALLRRLPNVLSCQHWWNVSLPPFEIFSPKKEMETHIACMGEGGGREGGRGVGAPAGGSEREEREREWRPRGCSHLDLLYGHFHWTKMEGGGSFWIYWWEGEESRAKALKTGLY